jgi:RimJ/RimL family protein N-acetyltransferase
MCDVESGQRTGSGVDYLGPRSQVSGAGLPSLPFTHAGSAVASGAPEHLLSGFNESRRPAQAFRGSTGYAATGARSSRSGCGSVRANGDGRWVRKLYDEFVIHLARLTLCPAIRGRSGGDRRHRPCRTARSPERTDLPRTERFIVGVRSHATRRRIRIRPVPAGAHRLRVRSSRTPGDHTPGLCLARMMGADGRPFRPMTLRDVTPADVDAYVQMRCTAAMTRYLGGPRRPEDMPDKVRRDVAAVGAGRVLVCMIVPQDDPSEAAGTVTLTPLMDRPGSEIGWMVLPEYQGQGIGTFAVREVLRRACGEARWGEVHAYPHIANRASNALCQRIRFARRGEIEIAFGGAVLRANDWVVDPCSSP